MNVPNGIVAGITEDPTTVWTSDQLIDAGIAGGVKPAGTSGYSTTNYIVAQQIAASITGKSIQDLIAEQLTGPLGMSTAALPPNDDTALPAPATHGYLNTLCAAEVAADGGTAPAGQDTADWNASYGQGGGGMHATLTDLGRWGASELGSALLSDASAGERLKFTKLPEGIDYGLGLIDYGDGFVGHSGEALGWQAQVAHNPTTGLTVAMGTNACAGADGLMFDTVRAVLASTMNPPEGSMSPPEESAAPGTVVDVAAANEFKTLVAAMTAADLAETLSGEGPFTVFAPTDAAFEELPEGVLDALLLPENKDALTKILTCHVLEGEVMAADVTAGDVETVEGSTVTITTDGGVKVNDANVVVPDVDASNGVIHVIDAVLIPESVDLAALTS
jgi:uncharacterized surface protein with fasciclin (FAS1) repeats